MNLRTRTAFHPSRVARARTEQVLTLDSARELLAALLTRRHPAINPARVQHPVVNVTQQLKVRQDVMRLVSVEVVNLKAVRDRAVRLLPDVPVLIHAPAINRNHSITLCADAVTSRPRVVGALARAIHAMVRSVVTKDDGALRAGDLNVRGILFWHGTNPLVASRGQLTLRSGVFMF